MEKEVLRGLLNLRENSENERLGPNDINAEGYKLIESDVRDGQIITNKLLSMDVNPALPTLVITECLLIYMSAQDTSTVLNWNMDFFGNTGQIAFVNYEMINPDD